jgi:hypothetical protein
METTSFAICENLKKNMEISCIKSDYNCTENIISYYNCIKNVKEQEKKKERQEIIRTVDNIMKHWK